MVRLEPNSPLMEACREPTYVFDESNVSILMRGWLLADMDCPLICKKYKQYVLYRIYIPLIILSNQKIKYIKILVTYLYLQLVLG